MDGSGMDTSGLRDIVAEGDRNDRRILLVPFFLAAFAAVRLVYLASPDLVANYPFHFPDSFDWIINGLYYLRLWRGELPPEITIRQPLFPALIAAGYSLHWPQVIVAFLPFTTFLSICAFFRFARLFALRPALTNTGVLIFSLHYPLNFYSYYFMADPFGVALMLWSAVFYTQFFLRPKKANQCLVIASLFGGAASLIQLYGLIPALAFSLLLVLLALVKRRFSLVLLSVLNVVLAGSAELLWMGAKKELFGSYFATRVTQFGFLRFSLENSAFYAQVWPVYFAPLVILLALLLPFARRPLIPEPLRVPAIYLACVVVAFKMFLFFYQVQDSRFTTCFLFPGYLLGLFLIDRAATARIPRSYQFTASFLAIYAAFAPTDYLDRPTRSVYFATLTRPGDLVQTNIFTRLFETEKTDRLEGNQCLRRDALTSSITVDESCRQVPVQMYVNDSLKGYLDFLAR